MNCIRMYIPNRTPVKNWINVVRKNRYSVEIAIGGDLKGTGISALPIKESADVVYITFHKDGIVEVAPGVDGRKMRLYEVSYSLQELRWKNE